MRHLLPLSALVLLSACGMKGDLYEAPPPAEPVLEPATGDTDKGERKMIPSTPDPARSE
jgi:predicted small lipoprotein YifL